MFGDSCRFRHVDEKCVTQDYEIYKCEKRHSKMCRYKNDFGYCKFNTYCKYELDKSKDIVEQNMKIEEL